MSLSLTQQIKQTFGLAALSYEASKLSTPQEWQEFQHIKQRFSEARRKAEHAYRSEYDTRVEIARQELLSKAGRKSKDFKPRFARIDRFNKNALTRQAHRQVQQDHQNLLIALEKNEHQDIEKLLTRAQQKPAEINSEQQKDHQQGQKRRRQSKRAR